MSTKAEHRATVLMELETGHISLEAALASLECCERHLRRLRAVLLAKGPLGLNHGNLGRLPWHALDHSTRDRAVSLYREPRYFGTNFHQFTEWLAEREGIVVSRPVVHRWLTADGIAPPHPQKRRKRHRRRRERSAREGHMIQLDGSLHRWVAHLPKFVIMSAVDDATSKLWLGIRPTEDVRAYMDLLKKVCTSVGRPHIAYTDGFSSFGKSQRFSAEKRKSDTAQLKRVLKQLGVQHITAGSAPAKGRVERSFNTLQDRLVSHLRADQVETMDDVARSLVGYERNHNLRLAKPAHDPQPAWKPWPPQLTPDEVFCLHDVRVVRNDNTIVFLGRIIDLPPAPGNASRAKQRVDVLTGFDGTTTVKQGNERLALVLPARSQIPKRPKRANQTHSSQITSADRIPELLADRI